MRLISTPQFLFEPTTLAIIAVAATAAGTGVSMYAQSEAAASQKKAEEYNAQVQNNNALAAEQQAAYEAAQERLKTRKVLGAQLAAQGKNGISGGGSAYDVFYDSSVQGELDAMAALYTGKVQANAYRSGAQLSSLRAKNTDPTLGMAGTALGGLGSSLSAYGQFKKQQPTPKSPTKTG